MKSEYKKCYFCGSECEIFSAPLIHTLKQYECKCCGIYLLNERPDFYGISEPSIKFKIACVLNERRLKGLGKIVLIRNTDANVKVNDCTAISIEDLLNEYPKKASDFIVRSLLNLSRLVEHPFDQLELTWEPTNKYHVFLENGGQADSFLMELKNQGWISSDNDSNNWEFWCFTITAKSWEMIENLEQSATDSKRVFVAMWFDSSTDTFYKEGIKPAIDEAGYDADRIDFKEFNNKICDEIIAGIKRSKFIVADFVGQRGGVYYEAGYASGLNKPVIYTVREDEVKNLHFDTRQYNHIVYNSPEDLRKKLCNRICATIV